MKLRFQDIARDELVVDILCQRNVNTIVLYPRPQLQLKSTRGAGWHSVRCLHVPSEMFQVNDFSKDILRISFANRGCAVYASRHWH